MPPRLKMVAEEILMCGLKSIPVAGKALEVIDAVRTRHAMLAQTFATPLFEPGREIRVGPRKRDSSDIAKSGSEEAGQVRYC